MVSEPDIGRRASKEAMCVTAMVVLKSLDPSTFNLDSGNEEQSVEGTAPVEAVTKPAAPSASRDQPTVVIILEAL